MADPSPGAAVDPSALRLVLRYLLCPICAGPFAASAAVLACAAGHSFDIARQGYVSFLTGHAGTGTADTADMVAARARFQGRGFYDSIADSIIGGVDSRASGLALEIGGGTGFYLSRLLDARPALVGIDLDLSARALRIAARTNPRLAAVGADAWLALPIADASAGVVLSVFSPRNPGEIARVLAPDGVLVVVSPTDRHLIELVTALDLVTVDHRKPERMERQFAAFQLLDVTPVEYEIALAPEDVRDVVLMGPSARHLDRARLEDLPERTAVTVSVERRIFGRP